MKKFTTLLFLAAMLFFMVMNVRSDDISIISVSSSPREVAPGQNTELVLSLRNIGNKDIKDITVKLDLSNVPFAPVASSSEFLIKKLEDDEDRNVIFSLITLPNATPGIYKIPVEISYSNLTKKTLVSLTVQVKPELLISLDKSDLLYLGSSGTIIVKFVNRGLTDIKFLTATLETSNSYDILSPASVYIGNLDIDDTQTEEFDIFMKSSSGAFPIKIEYRDSNNNQYSETKIINANVYTREEAEDLGLIKKNNSMLFWILIAVVVVLFFVFRSRRKSK